MFSLLDIKEVIPVIQPFPKYQKRFPSIAERTVQQKQRAWYLGIESGVDGKYSWTREAIFPPNSTISNYDSYTDFLENLIRIPYTNKLIPSKYAFRANLMVGE